MNRVVPFLLCLWPGLARLWLQGSFSALAGAVLFAAAVNSALVVTFIWPEMAGNELPAWFLPGTSWLLVLCLWVAGAWQSRQMFLTWATPPVDQQSERLFRQSQGEYLRGNYSAAERLLTELLTRRPADAEGKLLLATVLRRAKRPADASRCLQELCELPAGMRWEREIGLERALLTKPPEEEEDEIETTAVKTPSVKLPQTNEPNPLPAGPTTAATGKPKPNTTGDDDEIDVIAYERVEQERSRRAA